MRFIPSTAYRNSCASLAQGLPQSPGLYAAAATGTGFTKWTSRNMVLLAVVVGVLAYGCGGSSEQKTASAPPPPAASSQPAAGASSAPAVSVADGKKLFQQTCTACHGMEGQGVPNLGKDMTTSAFIKKLTDAELIAFIKQGRMPGDPANTTGVAMPPKGGNPALQDAQLQGIVAYIRTLIK